MTQCLLTYLVTVAYLGFRKGGASQRDAECVEGFVRVRGWGLLSRKL